MIPYDFTNSGGMFQQMRDALHVMKFFDDYGGLIGFFALIITILVIIFTSPNPPK